MGKTNWGLKRSNSVDMGYYSMDEIMSSHRDMQLKNSMNWVTRSNMVSNADQTTDIYRAFETM